MQAKASIEKTGTRYNQRLWVLSPRTGTADCSGRPGRLARELAHDLEEAPLQRIQWDDGMQSQTPTFT